MLIFVYARFIEPQIIVIHNTEVNLWFKTKIALISDLHIWTYKWEIFLERMVSKINKLDIDSVMIAWDVTGYLNKTQLEELLEPLKEINKPVYWVLWNHDVELPGPKIRDELKELLDSYNFTHLNNQSVQIWPYTLVWLWSHRNNEDDITLLEKFTQEDNIVVLTHNPDTTNKYTNNIADLTLAGHTHGGQIRIPWLYKKVIPTRGNFDQWLTQETNTQLFVTSWLGETWLPLRLFNFPVIDVIEIK